MTATYVTQLLLKAAIIDMMIQLSHHIESPTHMLSTFYKTRTTAYSIA